MSGGWNEDDRTWANTNIAGFDSFIDFVKHWLTAENIRKHRHFWPQHMFVCDARNRLLVDYLAYFETIEDDFTRICSVLNIDSELGRHNINPGNSYRGAYDDDSRDIVAEVYSTDIQLLGYDFDGIHKRTTVIRP